MYGVDEDEVETLEVQDEETGQWEAIEATHV
jgi:hypothetical protein